MGRLAGIQLCERNSSGRHLAPPTHEPDVCLFRLPVPVSPLFLHFSVSLSYTHLLDFSKVPGVPDAILNGVFYRF